MQVCKLQVFNLAYLYALHVLTIAKLFKMSKHRNKSIKTKLNMNKIVKRDKTTENERKSSQKEQEKRR